MLHGVSFSEVDRFERMHPGMFVRLSKGGGMLLVTDRWANTIATIGPDCGYPTLAALSAALTAGKIGK